MTTVEVPVDGVDAPTVREVAVPPNVPVVRDTNTVVDIALTRHTHHRVPVGVPAPLPRVDIERAVPVVVHKRVDVPVRRHKNVLRVACHETAVGVPFDDVAEHAVHVDDVDRVVERRVSQPAAIDADHHVATTGDTVVRAVRAVPTASRAVDAHAVDVPSVRKDVVDVVATDDADETAVVPRAVVRNRHVVDDAVRPLVLDTLWIVPHRRPRVEAVVITDAVGVAETVLVAGAVPHAVRHTRRVAHGVADDVRATHATTNDVPPDVDLRAAVATVAANAVEATAAAVGEPVAEAVAANDVEVHVTATVEKAVSHAVEVDGVAGSVAIGVRDVVHTTAVPHQHAVEHAIDMPATTTADIGVATTIDTVARVGVVRTTDVAVERVDVVRRDVAAQRQVPR